MAFLGRFPECQDCVFYRYSRPRAQCMGCGSGEFFEEKDSNTDNPSDDDLMTLLKDMDTYD